MFNGMRSKYPLSVLCIACALLCSVQSLAETTTTTFFSFADPQHRWKDFDDKVYRDAYISSYNYGQSTVQLTYDTAGELFSGQLGAQDLKPNFVYQVKLQGYGTTAYDVANDTPKQTANEAIGYAGRWWKETWSGTSWINGMNTDDADYLQNYAITDSTSPTGLKYRYVGYMLISFFATDGSGSAVHNIASDRSYHVLWRTIEAVTEADLITAAPEYILPAYQFFGQEWSIYPEVEKSAADFSNGLFLTAGQYECQIVLTEESWHQVDANDGNWATVLGADLAFEVTATQPPTTGSISGVVTDADTAEPIAGASVSTATESTTTDQSGYYSITVPAETTTVTVVADRYESQSATVMVPENQTVIQDFVLVAEAVPTNSVIVADITYATSGGRNNDKHLTVTVSLEDQNGMPVSGAQVIATVYHDSTPVLSINAITEANGAIAAALNNAANGTYTTTVGSVDAGDLTWDGITPSNSFTK